MTSNTHYDEFYENKDFKRFTLAENALVKTIVSRYGLQGGTVIDIGCGTGRYTELFRKASMVATGVDSSSQAIKIAKDKYPDCSFFSDSIEDFKSGIGHYDLVFCHGFSPFLHKDIFQHADMLLKLSCFLKNDGILFFGATSFLTGKQNKRGSRWDHALATYLELFMKVEPLHVIEHATVYPHCFLLPQSFAFSKLISGMSSALTLKVGKFPLRVYVTCKRLSNSVNSIGQQTATK